ncbi:MAG: hypothetical protein ACLVJN_04430 [Streptococcus parasanguinis]
MSKMEATDLNQALADHFTEEELAATSSRVRGYQLTDKGKQALKDIKPPSTATPRKIYKNSAY